MMVISKSKTMKNTQKNFLSYLFESMKVMYKDIVISIFFIFVFVQRLHLCSQDGADPLLLKDSAEFWDYRHGPLTLAWILDLNYKFNKAWCFQSKRWTASFASLDDKCPLTVTLNCD